MKSQQGGSITCPLCLACGPAHYAVDRDRSYLHCGHCSLVFVTSDQHLSCEEEKAIYEQHQNSPDDQDYRRFLSRLTVPLLDRIKPQSHGLDFGCGPGPTLSVMMAEQAHHMALYDIYYANDPLVLQTQYDFITSTEVVEHLANPRHELDSLWALIRPGGYLGLMTKLVKDQQSFSTWHYKNDLTHICFFSVATFKYLAEAWGADIEFIGSDVIILYK
ncbi:MAG: class I SAM-dependent methyltransferase [Porticoccaceae bacterium]|nr:class I SAM-dependent methyltransferase [Porticoccaceae bacterium]